MGYPLTVRCSNCRFEQSIETRPITWWYVLSDDRRVKCDASSGWCEFCGKVTVIETIPSLAVLAERLRTAAEANASVEPIVSAVTWRTGRESPPRCLECGSVAVRPFEWRPIDEVSEVEIVALPRVAAGFRHECGGVLTATVNYAIRVDYSGVRVLLSREGEVLGEEVDDDDADPYLT